MNLFSLVKSTHTYIFLIRHKNKHTDCRKQIQYHISLKETFLSSKPCTFVQSYFYSNYDIWILVIYFHTYQHFRKRNYMLGCFFYTKAKITDPFCSTCMGTPSNNNKISEWAINIFSALCTFIVVHENKGFVTRKIRVAASKNVALFLAGLCWKLSPG